MSSSGSYAAMRSDSRCTSGSTGAPVAAGVYAGPSCGLSRVRVFCARECSGGVTVCMGPNLEVYVINVSFDELKDATERAYLNEQPAFVALPPEAVDRLRAAVENIVLESPDFQRCLKNLGDRPARAPMPAVRPAPAP